MSKPAQRKRLSANEMIGYMIDRPRVFVMKTMTRRGPIWTFNTLELLSPEARLLLIGRGSLVERDPAVAPTGPAGSQSYILNPKFREAGAR